MEKKIRLSGWIVAEDIYFTDGLIYHRIDEDGIIEYYNEGYVNVYEERIQDEKLYNQLEDFYQNSKEGYGYFLKK